MAKKDGEATTVYYPIQYPFSVDRDADLRDPKQPSGRFGRLVNMIVYGQVLKTRYGISELVHTADTSDVVSTNDFSGDANCISWYKLDTYSGNIAADSQGSNPMTGISTGNSAYLTQDFTNTIAPGLTASLSLDNSPTNNSAFVTCPIGSQGTAMPGQVGENTTLSFCGWLRWSGTTQLNSRGIFGRWDASSAARSFLLYAFSTANTIRFLVRDTGGSNADIDTGIALVSEKWYHVKGTFDSATNTSTLRVCNSSGTTIYTGNDTIPNGMETINQALTLGAFNADETRAWDGNLQEWVLFKDIVTDSEQDDIIAGTYS